MSECVLKTLACRGLRVGPSKGPSSVRLRFGQVAVRAAPVFGSDGFCGEKGLTASTSREHWCGNCAAKSAAKTRHKSAA